MFKQRLFKKSHLLWLLIICCGLFLTHIASSDNGGKVHMIQLDDATINPVTAEYIVEAIDKAYEENAKCLIIKMDTPGGLLNSTRLIVKRMLIAKVPVVVYIAPSGSRAGSAGVFITYASHVAAMAPSTNIGAAHPVQMGGQKKQTNDWEELRDLIKDLKEGTKRTKGEDAQKEEPAAEEEDQEDSQKELYRDEDPMGSKILNDTVAFIKAIAKQRGRNIEWGIESVTKSASITESEALEKGVVEIIAKDDRDLLEQLDGRVVTIDGEQITLSTQNATIEKIEMDSRQKFFNVLANPNIAYFLMILGFYGLLYEITHPGFGVPGIMGFIFLILAFYSLQTLPTNYAGLALMTLGIVLLISEAFIPGIGLLSLGGLVCLVLGSMLLFESVDPVMRVSISAIAAFALTTSVITVFLIRSAIRSHRAKIQGGKEGLIGEVGEVQKPLRKGKQGKVFVRGELWNAYSEQDMQKGEEVIVEEVDGLKIKVKRKIKEE